MDSSYQSYDDQLIASLSEIAESENETTSKSVSSILFSAKILSLS